MPAASGKAKAAAASKQKPNAARAELERLQGDLTVTRAMAENSPINILLADVNLNITYANPASIKTLHTLQAYLPVRVEEIVGKSIDIFHKNQDMQRPLPANERNLPHRAT